MSRFIRPISAAVAAVFVLGIVSPPALATVNQAPPANTAAIQSVAQDVAAACAEQAGLYQELTQLRERQAVLRQIVANYGFTNTAAEFEAATEFLSERERATRPKPLMKDLYDKTVAEAKKHLGDSIRVLQNAPEAVGSINPQFLQAIRKLPMPQSLRDEILRLAQNPATRMRGYGIALDWVDKFMIPLELMEAADDGNLLLVWKAFIEAASVVWPPYGALLKQIDWAGKNLYNAVTGQWTAHQIRTLTTSTEADLSTLRQRTEELAQIARRMKAINARSPELASRCDTTRLTRAQPETAAGPTGTPVPTADEKKSGMSDALFYGLLGAGVGGAYLYSEYQKTQGAQCTPPSVNVLTVCSSQGGSSPACVQARTEMQAYCSCLGKGYSGGNCTS